MNDKPGVVVVGASGHAKVIMDVIEQEGKYRIAGLIDTHKRVGESVFGYKVLGAEEYLPTLVKNGEVQGGLIAIGDNWVRSLLSDKIKSLVLEFQFIQAIHPSAVIGRGVRIGQGTVLMAGVIVNSDCRIGDFCILNTQASLDHDSLMEDFSSLAPGVTTGGNVTIGGYSAISLGASVSHGVSVGEHTVLGAGSVALQDIPSYCMAYGTPAKVIRKRGKGDRYL